MNNIEKAIEIMKYNKHLLGLPEQGETWKENANTIACDIAISALEKQLNGGWIPFKTEYDRYFKMDMLRGEIPEEDEEILVTDGKSVWMDTFMREGTDCYLDSGNSLVDKAIAWQPLPPVYVEVENE